LEHHDHEGHGFDHPSRTDREDGRHGGLTPRAAAGSSVVQMCQEPSVRSVTAERARRAVHMTGVGTGFSHTVEFSRNVVGTLRRLARGSRVGLRRLSGGDPSTGLSSSSNLQPTHGTPAGALGALLTLHTEAPPHAPRSRRQSGHRKPWGNPFWPSATSCLPLSTSHRRRCFPDGMPV